MFANIKAWLIGGAVLLTIAVIGIAYSDGKIDGGVGVKAKIEKQNTAILKKVKKNNEKIDKQTPFGSDKHTAINWLFQYTRPSN